MKYFFFLVGTAALLCCRSVTLQSGQFSGNASVIEQEKIDACQQHAGTRRFHRCLQFSDGACFHYGEPCEPQDRCVLLEDNKYHYCTRFSLGVCAAVEGTCTPKSLCTFDNNRGRFRVCVEWSDGYCKAFGRVCSDLELDVRTRDKRQP